MTNSNRGKVPDYLLNRQTEYNRLGIEPEQFVDDRFAANAAKRNFQVQSGHLKRGPAGVPAPPPAGMPANPPAGVPAPPSIPPKPQQVEPPVRQPDRQPTHQGLPVHVGNHEDQMWVDARSMGGQNAPSEYIDNNEYVDVEALQNKTSRVYDVVQEPPQKQPADTAPVSVSVKPEEYIVIYNDTVVTVSADENVVRNAIENVLVHSRASVEDIVVYRRVPIDFGVLLK